MWHTLTVECFSALRRREFLTHVMTWVNLEGIILIEMNQSPKNKYCMILLTCDTSSSQNHRESSRMLIARDWREGGWGVV